ncbi:hypothetical protein EJ04DRAFT_587982 [Polyplosphaeria fusca]|uniref:F-box domain-containing protein n=1 Tax=Polyplosphaeria fusca TaxID=682080 RepID=A0A9P4R7M5_9PLEO|nr:hypothetical protein EJ04DRAFT_587982 [Polyplosphaeria fusca]
MASFIDLPQELKDSILVDIKHKDLSALSLTCKRLRASAIPFLYADIRMIWKAEICLHAPYSRGTECRGTYSPRLDLLLRSIIESPPLAAMIKNVALQAEGFFDQGVVLRIENDTFSPGLPIPKESHAGAFMAFAEQIGYAGNNETFKAAVGNNSLHAILPLFLTACPNLNRLHLGLSFVLKNQIFANFLSCAYPNNITARSPFGQLKSLEVGTVPEDLQVQPFSQLDYKLLDAVYVHLLHMPTLERAHLANVPSPIPFNYNRGSSQEERLYSLPISTQTSTLRSLELIQTGISETVLGKVLATTPKLTSLTYDPIINPRGDRFGFMDGEELAAALAHVKNSLTDLKISYTGNFDEIETFHHCSLRHMSTLKTLEVPMTVLLGWFNWQRKPKLPSIADSLPCRLEKLVLGEDYWWIEDILHWNEQEIMKALEEFVDHGRWRQATPQLVEMSVLLANEEDALRDGDHYARAEEFKNLCEVNGLRCADFRLHPRLRQLLVADQKYVPGVEMGIKSARFMGETKVNGRREGKYVP